MKVIHVVPGIAEQASGPSYSVPALCRELAAQNVELELHVNLGSKPHNAGYKFYSNGAWKWPPRLDISPKMYKSLKKTAVNAEIIHSHGLWNMSNIYPGWVARDRQCCLVVSPRGTLGTYPLRLSRWKKFAIWHLWQHRVLGQAACIHATCEAEYKEVRNAGIKAPVAIIGNGVEVHQFSNEPFVSDSETRRLLFFGRITPKKGIDMLLKAWTAVQQQFSDWELQITGIDDRGHLGQMKLLAEGLGVERVYFTGPVYGQDKTRLFHSSELFVLPTHSENFGMAVAEALAHEVPAVVTKGAPWQGLESENCGWWVDVGVEPLVGALKTALAESPEKLRNLGIRGRRWMQRDFCWSTIGEKMLKTYQWILKGGDAPEWVLFD